MDKSEKDWNRCVEFHGHECPGLAIGFRAARGALTHLGEDRAPDEELVAVVENDACGVDAVQVLTGCTFGKGNLIHRDYGKQAFNFFERTSGRGVRLSIRAGALALEDRQRELMQKAREGKATEKERAELTERRQRTMQSVLERPLEELFSIDEPALELPAKAVVQRSRICPRCGEPTMPNKMVEGSGELLCRPCASAREQADSK